MPRNEDERLFKEALLLICEGTKTEPNFFGSFSEDKDNCKINKEIVILPKPSLTENDITLQIDRGNMRRKKRDLLGNKENEESPIFYGPPPLNWVQSGIDKLNTYEEVWCIFDKDDHPKRKDAFELVEESRNDGKNIHIAFSSRCIEYYFLLHFEYLYKAFEKSECNEKVDDKSYVFHCGLPDAVVGKACNGERCVNGYARIKGYWTESKGNISLYPNLKDRLLLAILNAELLRRESWKLDNDTPIYDRNPYVTIDYLIARLLGYSIISIGEIVKTKEASTTLSITLNEEGLIIKNDGTASFIVNENFVCEKALIKGNLDESCCIRQLLKPGMTYPLELKREKTTLFCINSLNVAYLFVI